jgi:hypothetical protein
MSINSIAASLRQYHRAFSVLALLTLVGACGRTPLPTVHPTPEDPRLVLVAAATEMRKLLPPSEVALDTAGLEPRFIDAVISVLDARPVRRNEVLHYSPPIYRLEGAGALVWFAPPTVFSSVEARVLVEVWSEGTPQRGAAITAFRMVLGRESDGTWRVRSRELVVGS